MKYILIRLAFLVCLTGIINASAVAKIDDPSLKIYVTGGTMTVDFTSVENGAKYSPRHVLAVWVEKEDGSFVKTLKLNADRRKQYLYTWNSKSSGNTTDATTGATLSSHQSHSITWNATDLQGNIVEDGNYVIRVEYTSEHAQGPMFSVSFSKGTTMESLNPPDDTYFKNISVSFTPETSFAGESLIAKSLRVFPVPATDRLVFYKAEGYVFNMYNNNGMLIKAFPVIPAEFYEIDISKLAPGSYILIGSKEAESHRQIIQIIE